MTKTLAQKVKEFVLKGEQDKAKRIYKKTFQLEKKYEKMIDLRAEKLTIKHDTELLKATKKIIRQVDTVVKRKIRDAKGWKPTKVPVKKKSLPKLKQKLLTLIQKHSRLRDSDENGYGSCISCGDVRHYKKADGGHYKSRKENVTAFREDNIHLQCKPCNGGFKTGPDGTLYDVKDGYRRRLNEKCGAGYWQMLEKLVRSNPVVSLNREWMESQIPLYKEKIKDLESKKI